MTTAACSRYAGYRFPAEIISHAVWLYFRFPLALRMVEELLACRGIVVSHEPYGSGRSSSAGRTRTAWLWIYVRDDLWSPITLTRQNG